MAGENREAPEGAKSFKVSTDKPPVESPQQGGNFLTNLGNKKEIITIITMIQRKFCMLACMPARS